MFLRHFCFRVGGILAGDHWLGYNEIAIFFLNIRSIDCDANSFLVFFPWFPFRFGRVVGSFYNF